MYILLTCVVVISLHYISSKVSDINIIFILYVGIEMCDSNIEETGACDNELNKSGKFFLVSFVLFKSNKKN